MTKTIQIKRPGLFKEQQLIYNALEKCRYVVMCCGRRWGKDFLIVRIIIDKLVKDGLKIALYSPEVQMTVQIFEMVYAAVWQLVKSKNSSAMRMELVNGGKLEGWHLQHNNQGRGRKYHLVVINEVAFAKSDFKERMYYDTIRPTISTKGEEGKVLFASTPMGDNFFYDFYQIAKDDTTGNWACFHYESINSPFMDVKEVEEARKEMPSVLFRRNYEAAFEGSNENQLIERSDITKNLIEKPLNRLKGEKVLGADFCGDGINGETKDFNTLAIRDGMQIVYYEKNKFMQVDFVKHILMVAIKYNVTTIVCDHIGVGSGTVVAIRRLIEGYNQKIEAETTEGEAPRYCEITVRSFNNLIERRKKERLRKKERRTIVEDVDLFFNNYARVSYLFSLALKEGAFKIVKNDKLDKEMIDQFVKIEYEYCSKGQESVIRVCKKGIEENKKSPDIPDAIFYTLTSTCFSSLTSRKAA